MAAPADESIPLSVGRALMRIFPSVIGGGGGCRFSLPISPQRRTPGGNYFPGPEFRLSVLTSCHHGESPSPKHSNQPKFSSSPPTSTRASWTSVVTSKMWMIFVAKNITSSTSCVTQLIFLLFIVISKYHAVT